MSIGRKLRTLLLAGTMAAPLLSGSAGAASPVSAAIAWHPGFVIRAEDRFDPAVQRLMAEYSLRSLPLERGQLYYLYPIGVTPRLEGMQIRYLESLLDKQASAAEAAGDRPCSSLGSRAAPQMENRARPKRERHAPEDSDARRVIFSRCLEPTPLRA